MNKILPMLPYLIVNLFSFYFYTIRILDSSGEVVAIFLAIPFMVFVISHIYGVTTDVSPFYPILVGLLCLPSIIYLRTPVEIVFASILYVGVAYFGSYSGSKLRERGIQSKFGFLRKDD